MVSSSCHKDFDTDSVTGVDRGPQGVKFELTLPQFAKLRKSVIRVMKIKLRKLPTPYLLLIVDLRFP